MGLREMFDWKFFFLLLIIASDHSRFQSKSILLFIASLEYLNSILFSDNLGPMMFEITMGFIFSLFHVLL